MHHRRLLLLATSAVCALAVSAHAQSASPQSGAQTASKPDATSVEEVIVTAQKRSQNVQTVPLSIVAVSAARLEDANVKDVTQLSRVVPNLQFTQIAQATGVGIRIRGFGASSNAAIDPSVAPYIDGIYIPRPGVILSNFLDIESVEVLRGPQGTLFGRNATVGALSLRSGTPSFSKASGELTGELGTYGDRRLEGVGNLPVTDNFAVRLAVLATNTDGFYHNRLDDKDYGGRQNEAFRLSGRWAITPRLTWTARVDYAHSSGDGFNYPQFDVGSTTPAQLASYLSHFGGNPPTVSSTPSLEMNEVMDNPRLKDDQGGFSSDLSWDVGAGYTLRLINGFRNWRNFQSDGDVVYTPLDLLDRQATFDSSSQSHELQFISPKGALLGGKLDFVSGLYYFDEDYKITETFDIGSQYCSLLFAAAPARLGPCNAGPKQNASYNVFNQYARSYAAYIQGNYALTDTLSITLGARESRDDKTGSSVQIVNNPGITSLRAAENTNLSYEKSRASYRAGINWQATPSVLAFFTYSTGYKSGGLNSAPGAAPLGQARLFNAETAEDFELGVKSTWFGRRLLLNATLYETDLNNFQDRSYNGTSFVIRNAGSVRARGLELEGQARPTSSIRLDFGLAYLDSIYTDNRNAPAYPGCTGAVGSCALIQDLTGRTTPLAPKWQGNFGAEYSFPSFMGGYTATLRGDMNFFTRQYTENTLNPQGVIDGQALLGLRATFKSPDRLWTLALYSENVTDQRYYVFKFAQTFAGPLGGNVPATGATIYRAYQGAPRTFGARLTRTF